MAGLFSSRAVLAGLALLTVLVGIQWQRNLSAYYQTDFAAYWSAGRALNEGVYRYNYRSFDAEGMPFAHAMFLNPPIVAQPFRLLGVLSYDAAKTVWYYLLLILFVGVIFVLSRNWRLGIIIAAVIIIGMPFIFWPLFAELERGETNMIPLATATAAYFLWRRDKFAAAGAVLGLGSAFKFPLLIIFVVPLALRRWRMVAAGAAMFAGVFLVSLAADGLAINRVYFVEYLPVISLKDTLPHEVFPREYTPRPPVARWEGRTYVTRFPFQAPSGSATRFFRDLFDYRFDRSLVLGGAALTGLAIVVGAWRQRIALMPHRMRIVWEDMAWSATVMATLILHTLSWITNYVVFIFPFLLLWRYVVDWPATKVARQVAVGLLVGTTAIVMGDPISTRLPSPWLVTDILLRNRVWLGGTLIWGILLLLLVTSSWRHFVPRRP